MRHKSWKLSIVGLILLIIVIAVSVSMSKDSKEEGSTTNVTEPSPEGVVFEKPTEAEESEIEESDSTDIIEEVDLDVDFKFNTNRNTTVEIETYTEEDINIETVQEDKAIQMFVQRDLDSSLGWFYQPTENMEISTFGPNVQFLGKHSQSIYDVREVEGNLTDDELWKAATLFTPCIVYLQSKHEIPFNTPYSLEKGVDNAEEYFEDVNGDGVFGEESYLEDNWTVLFESSTDLENGTIHYIGWYDHLSSMFNIDGYYKNKDGRYFIFNGRDSYYKYMIAYLTDIFDNCIIPL